MIGRLTHRPHRRLVYPFVLVLYPMLWFIIRELQINSSDSFVTDAFALTVGAVVVSYVIAILVSQAFDLRRESGPPWARRFVAPSNATLAIFGTVSLLLGAFIVAGSLFSLPQWLDTVARGLSVVIGWPLFVVVLVAFAVGNAVGGSPSFVVQSLFVAVGIALSTTWLFVLSGWLAAATTPRESAATRN